MDDVESFITNVSLITSSGPYGHNVMACEWTHQISYTPGLILVCIGPNKATFQNIKTKYEFGVNICGFDQNMVSSVAGNSSGKKVNKIEVLKELGVRFYEAKTIDSLMIEGASLNAECKVIRYIDIGDHHLFIGEVLVVQETKKEPLIYHQGKYFRLGQPIQKPSQETLSHIKELIEKFKK